jgi:predicted transposase/invertase (TIGR01784 family)
MAFDNLCKLLAEKYPQTSTEWLFGQVPEPVELLKTELSIEPIRADTVTFLRTSGRIFHFEFQTIWPTEPPMPLRCLDYWVRLHRLYRLPISQVVVVLLAPSDSTTIETAFRLESTSHEFTVVKMWEQDPAVFLADPALLPFAALTEMGNAEALLQQVADRVATITPIEEQRQVSAYVQLMAGLKYNKETIKQVFSEGIMRESVIFQEIIQEGERRGEAKGETKGRLEIARELLADGMAIEKIARITHLSIEQIQQIQPD